MIKEKGPWGTIQALGIPLANTDGTLPDQAKRLGDFKWFFDNFSESNLVKFLNSCNLSVAQRKILLDKNFLAVTASNCIISPPQEIVYSLDSRSRGQIYAMLAQSPENYSQCCPFRFSTNNFEARLRNAGLTVPDIRLLKNLIYNDSHTECFCDLELARELISPEEFTRLTETIYQIPVYRLSLMVKPDSDVDALANYWGKGGREDIVRPLLMALTKVPEGTGINISFLLPSFPRLRLFTYPETWHDPEIESEDCTFSSMNFFNDKPDTNFFNPNHLAQVLPVEYEPVRGKPTFGDVIAVMSPNEQVIHMCVYIAGDFVFTKNGLNSGSPWAFMQLSDVYVAYCQPGWTHVEIFRRKDLTPPSSSMPNATGHALPSGTTNQPAKDDVTKPVSVRS